MPTSSNPQSNLPPCGLYKTLTEISVQEGKLNADLLVSFHNHSDQGLPIILLPEKNEHNRWIFQKKGYLLKNQNWARILEPLKQEGLYRCSERFSTNESEVVAENTLVQLGYTAKAEPILFFPVPLEGQNGFQFSEKGIKIPEKIYALLEPLNTHGPFKPKEELRH